MNFEILDPRGRVFVYVACPDFTSKLASLAHRPRNQQSRGSSSHPSGRAAPAKAAPAKRYFCFHTETIIICDDIAFFQNISSHIFVEKL